MHLFPAAFIPFSFPGEDLLSLNASIFFLTFDSRFTQIFKIRNGYRMHNVRNRQDLFSHMVITFSNDHSKHILLICSLWKLRLFSVSLAAKDIRRAIKRKCSHNLSRVGEMYPQWEPILILA